jgi:hypothetical protein
MTTFLAIWGAILSTALALSSFYKDLRDHAKVRVEASLSEWSEKDDDTEEVLDKYEMEIVLTNVGRRPVIVVSVGVGNINPSWIFWRRLPSWIRIRRNPPGGFFEATLDMKRVLPTRLDAGDFIALTRDNLFFFETSENCSLFAVDSLGRYYFLPKSAWDRMKRNYSR